MRGEITNVQWVRQGTGLDDDHASSASSLAVDDTYDFNWDEGGQLLVGEPDGTEDTDFELFSYTVTDDTTLALTDGPTALSYADGQEVLLYPVKGEYIAWIRPDEEQEEEVAARVPHFLVSQLETGTRNAGEGEAVEFVYDESGDVRLIDIVAEDVVIDGGYIDPGTFDEPPSDGVAPAVSPTPTVIGGYGALFVTWEGVTNSDPVTYDVYCDTVDDFTPDPDPGGNFIGEIRGTSFTIRALEDGSPLELGTTYYVKLVARDQDGAAAAGTQGSGAVTAVPSNELDSDGDPPGSSPTPVVQSAYGTLVVYWPGVPNDDSVIYEVHISTTNDFTPGPGTKLTETTSQEIVIRETAGGTPLSYGTTYYVKLIAKDEDGSAAAGSQGSATLDSMPSDEATTDGNAPSSSPTPTVLGSYGAFLLHWTPVANNDPVTYEVHISTSSGFTPGAGTKAYETSAPGVAIRTEADGSPLEFGTTYYFKLIAKDDDGSASASGQDSATLIAVPSDEQTSDGSAPSSSPTPTVNPLFRSLNVVWDPITNNDEVTYEVHVSTSSGFTPGAGTLVAETKGNSEVVSKTAGGSPLASGTTYYVKLIAKDADGSASASAQDSGQIDTAIDTDDVSSDGSAPSSSPTPTVLGGVSILGVQWDPVANNDLVTYEVHSSTSSGFTPGAGTLNTETTGTGAVLRETGAGAALVNGTTYYVKIVAKDADGSASASAQDSAQLVGGADFIVAGTILGDMILAGEIVTAHMDAGTIDADRLVAGSITSTELDADSVTASKLSVTVGGGNLQKNSSWEDADDWDRHWTPLNCTPTSESTTIHRGYGTKSWKGTSSASGLYGPKTAISATDLSPVEPGKTYTASAWVNPGSGASRDFTYILFWYQSDGSTPASPASSSQATNGVTNGVWSRITCTGTAPSDARYAGISPRANAPGASDVLYVDDVQLEEGDVATSYHPKTDEVLPGTIDADMITVTDLSAINADLGNITAGTVTGATLRTAASGDRVVMDSTGLEMFDGAVKVFDFNTADGSLSIQGSVTITGGDVPAGYVSGTLGTGNIPNLDTSKITTGTFADARIGSGITASKISGALSNATLNPDDLSADITSTHIGSNAIVSGLIAANAVDSYLIFTSGLFATEAHVDHAFVSGVIDADRIKSNSIDTLQLKADAVTADKLQVVLGGGNYVSNSSAVYQTVSDDWSTYQCTISSIATPSGIKSLYGGRVFEIAPTVAASQAQMHQYVEYVCEPGRTYTLSAWLAAGNAGASGEDMRVLCAFYDSTNTIITSPSTYYYGNVITASQTAWDRSVLTVEAPTDAEDMRVYVQIPSPDATSDRYIATGIQLEDGEVATSYHPKTDEILPGTIVANMIDVDAVTADKIDITNLATIGNASTGNLTVSGTLTGTGWSMTAGGIITGTKIRTADSTTRIELDAATNTLIGYDAGDEAFEMDADTGTVAIGGGIGESGQKRLEIDRSGIDIYGDYGDGLIINTASGTAQGRLSSGNTGWGAGNRIGIEAEGTSSEIQLSAKHSTNSAWYSRFFTSSWQAAWNYNVIWLEMQRGSASYYSNYQLASDNGIGSGEEANSSWLMMAGGAYNQDQIAYGTTSINNTNSGVSWKSVTANHNLTCSTAPTLAIACVSGVNVNYIAGTGGCTTTTVTLWAAHKNGTNGTFDIDVDWIVIGGT